MIKKFFRYLFLAAGVAIAHTASAQLQEQQNLFVTNPQSTHPYRIPAIATAANGDIFAISDYRPCGNDIGYGEVDVKCRISNDNGATWGEEFFVADGIGDNNGGEVWKTGFGDAAIVADAERNELLVMLVCGKTVCWNGNYIPNKPESNPNRVARVRAKFNENTYEWEWTKPVEVTEQIYSQFVDDKGTPTVKSLFIGSGRICQSRLIKVGEYYRLYCAVWTKNEGNRVLYSDDFGENWFVLGTINDRPAPAGDEPKCEELPDGSVLLSSRCNGRYFNIYSYTNIEKAEGKWSSVAHSGPQTNGVNAVGNSTNGEIMILPVVHKATKQKTYLALQSVPFGPKGRQNVGISYKELSDYATDFASPKHFATDWDGHCQVSNMGSAYSTMTLQKDFAIGFLYEESTFKRDYTIVYRRLTIEDITNGTYTYCDDPKFSKKYIANNVALQRVTAHIADKQTTFKVGEFHPLKKKEFLKIAKKARSQATPQAIATLNAAMLNAPLAPINGEHYYLRNMGFEEGKPAYNDNLYMTATSEGITVKPFDAQEKGQIWTLLHRSNGEWMLYNAHYKCYIGKVGKTSSVVALTNNVGDAGCFVLRSDSEGKTLFVDVNATDADHPCLHLSQQHKLVAWNGSQASMWEIIVTNFNKYKE